MPVSDFGNLLQRHEHWREGTVDWVAVATDQTEMTLTRFRETGAYLRGHFRLTSGLHSPEYLQCAVVLQYPVDAERFGQLLADRLREIVGSHAVDVVVAPAMGGLMIGHEVARALGARFVFTERQDGAMTLRRGLRVERGEVAVVVEDVITTGGSTIEVIRLLQEAGAEVLAAGSLVDRSAGAADVGVPRVALATLAVESFDPATCPLCAQGVPVVKPGSRPT